MGFTFRHVLQDQIWPVDSKVGYCSDITIKERRFITEKKSMIIKKKRVNTTIADHFGSIFWFYCVVYEENTSLQYFKCPSVELSMGERESGSRFRKIREFFCKQWYHHGNHHNISDSPSHSHLWCPFVLLGCFCVRLFRSLWSDVSQNDFRGHYISETRLNLLFWNK